jgi:hypothetical protein
MGVQTSEVGYTSATIGRGDHEVHKGYVVALEKIKQLHQTKPATKQQVIQLHQTKPANKQQVNQLHKRTISEYLRVAYLVTKVPSVNDLDGSL